MESTVSLEGLRLEASYEEGGSAYHRVHHEGDDWGAVAIG